MYSGVLPDKISIFGNIHQVVASDTAAFWYVRDFLSFLPSNCFDEPPIVNPGLEPELSPHNLELDAIVPDSDNAALDMHEIVLRIFDDGVFLEVGPKPGLQSSPAMPARHQDRRNSCRTPGSRCKLASP